MKRSGSLVRATVVQTGGRLVQAATTLITFPLIARYLGPSGTGRYVLILVTVSLLAAVGDLGLPLLTQRELAIGSGSETRHGLRRVRFRATVLITAVSGGALVLASPADLVAYWLGLAGVPAALAANHRTGELLSDLRPSSVTRIEIAGRAASLVALLWALRTDLGLAGVVSAATVGYWVTAIYGVTVTSSFGSRVGRAQRFAVVDGDMRILRRALPLTVIPMLGLVYSRTDTIVLAVFRTDPEVGIYGVMYRVIEIGLALLGVTASLLVTGATRVTSRERATFWVAAVTVVWPLAALGATVVAVLGDVVMLVLAGDGFTQPVDTPLGAQSPIVGLWLLMGAFGLMGFGLVAGALMLAWGLERALLVHFGIVIAVNVALSFALVPRWGLLGAALGTVAAEAVAVANSYRIIVGVLGDGTCRALLNRQVGRTAVLLLATLLAGLAAAAGPPTVRVVLVVGVAAVVAWGTGWARGVGTAAADLEHMSTAASGAGSARKEET